MAVALSVLALFFPAGCRQRRAVWGLDRPHRVVCLAPNLTELLCALGQTGLLAGVTVQCNWPAEVRQITKVGSFWQPDLERIVATRPDLVLGLDIPNHRLAAHRLERLGYASWLFRLERIRDLEAAIGRIGQLLGCQGQAGALQARLGGAIGVGRDPDRSGPRVLFVVQRRPLRVAGPGTFIDDAIRIAGGCNAMGPSVYQYPPIDTEQLLACRPDVIIEPVALAPRCGPCPANDGFWLRYAQLPAVKNGRVYAVDQDVVMRLGPRIADGIAQIAQCLQAH